MRRKIAQEAGHLDCRKSSPITFVATFQAGTIDRLLKRVASEDAKYHGHAGIELSELDATRCFRGDVIVMGSLAAQHASNANNRIESPISRHLLGHQRYLERAWDAHDLDLAFACSGVREGVECAREQPVRDEGVELAYDDAEAQTSCVQVAAQFALRLSRH